MAGGDLPVANAQSVAAKKIQNTIHAGRSWRQSPDGPGLHANGHNFQMRVLGGPGIGWWRHAARARVFARDQNQIGSAAFRVGFTQTRHVLVPVHRKVRRGHFIFRGQVEPDLKQFGRVVRVFLNEWKHFGMHDTPTRRHPLHITLAEPGGRAQRITVIDESLARDRDGLKSTVRMLGKTGDTIAVVHTPAVFARKIIADLTPAERRARGHVFVPGRIRVIVMDAKQKRVQGLPLKTKRSDFEYG